MAPADAAARRQPRENQYLFDLGVKGRKTGVTVPDNGVRDEHGLEPIDGLFSSPAKPAPKSTRSTHKTNGANGNATLSSSEDMDINDSTVPEPQDLLTERKRANMRLPPPRSKSPIKTYLQSPARRNPGYDPRSSPTRPSVVRRLDFSVNGDDYDQNSHEESLPDSSARGGRALSHPVNGTRLSPPANENEDDETGQLESYGDIEIGENSLQQVEYNEGPEEPNGEPEVEDGSEPEPELPTKVGRKRKTTASEPAESVPKRGRPAAKQKTIVNEVEEQVETQDEEQDEDRPTKRRRSGRHSLEGPAETLETTKAPSKSKSGRPKKPDNVIEKAANVSEAPKQKPTKPAGRKQKLPVISEVDSPEVTRGPPMPKNNRGLVILRRETPGVAGGFQQTRSGRNSIKPLAYWRGERVEWDETEEATDGYSKFLLPAIKEVVRTEESVANAAGKKSHKRGRKGKKRAVESDSEDDDEIEPWEIEPGRIVGEVREWDPQDPLGQETMDKEEELALSSAAIITREIAGATFKFAKTLTLPFFGSGMVDLPPGAVKKPKNSRKMQMAFFVHYGRVEVSINDNVFRIGKGGMWQVPRGNFYSITNDYDKPARIFFSQGNEVEAGSSEASA